MIKTISCFQLPFRAVAVLCLAAGLLFLPGTMPAARESAPAAPEKPPPPETIEPGQSCVNSDCHATMGKKKFLHGPINFGECEPCHIAIGNLHRFVKRPAGRELCLKCHEIPPPKAVRHKPFTEDCTLCHVLHESSERYFVEGGTSVQGCLREGCHEKFPRDHEVKHVSVEKGGCLVCHTSHQSEHEKLLTHEAGDLCTLCHIDFPMRLEGAVSSHTPRIRKNCTICHMPHGGEAKYLVPADEKKFCRKCHEILLDEHEYLAHPHSSMIAEKKCRECHEPHSSPRNRLLSQPAMDLCLGCHDKTVEMEGRTLSNIDKQIKDAKYVHGPIRQKDCVACHAAHGSELFDILKKPFPTAFYATHEKGAYDSCFDCHNRDFIELERTNLTGFRNGDHNLHYLHVIEKEKGRSCRTCHHEHASSQPKHIRTEIKFGQWDMPLEYTMTETGGGCATPCHPAYRYDHIRPVDNQKGEPRPIAASEKVPGRVRPSAPIITPPSVDPDEFAHIPSVALHAGEAAPFFSLSTRDGSVHNLDRVSTPTLLLFLNPSDPFTSPSLTAFHEIFDANPAEARKIRRWVVLPRQQRMSEVRRLEAAISGDWTVLLDSEGKVFPTYRIVATPTAVLLEGGRRIRQVYAGYDHNMARRVQADLNRFFNVEAAPKKTVELLTPTQLILQLARRLASRGLWESALDFYLEVEAKESLPPLAQIELAEIYMEMEMPDKAIEVLQKVKAPPEEQQRVALLLLRSQEIKAGKLVEPKPPAVTR